MTIEGIREIAERQYDTFLKTGDTEGMIGFEYKGSTIINPFLDVSGRFEVDTVAYYGEEFINSNFFKKENQ